MKSYSLTLSRLCFASVQRSVSAQIKSPQGHHYQQHAKTRTRVPREQEQVNQAQTILKTRGCTARVLPAEAMRLPELVLGVPES